LRQKLEVALVVFRRRGFVTEMAMFDDGEVQVRWCEVGSDGDGVFEVGSRFAVIAEVSVGDTERVEDFSAVAALLQGLPGLCPSGGAQIGEAEMVLRVRLGAVSEQGNGVIGLTVIEKGERKVVPGGGMTGVELESFFEAMDGSVSLAEVELADAKKVVGLRRGRTSSNGAREVRFRLREFLFLEIGDAFVEFVLR